jgi:predicted permease
MKIALRSLRKTPALCGAAVMVLGLGIGANLALFSMFRAVLMRPIPGVRNSDELVRMRRTQEGRVIGNQSYPDYLDFRDQSKTVRDLMAERIVPLRIDGPPAQMVTGAVVTGNYFEALGAKAVLGRVFASEDTRIAGASPVAVLSDRFWRRQFGGETGVVGRILKLNGFPFTIVGVAAAPFEGVEAQEHTEIWVPITMIAQALPRNANYSFLTERRAGWLTWYGRLAAGVTVDAASREWTQIAMQLETRYPQSNRDRRWRIHTHAAMTPGQRENLSGLLRLLLIAVGLVLLIACGNVANLLLARAAGRAREMAIRLALGASRWALVRELLAESLILGLASGAMGLILAPWFTSVLAKVWPRTPEQVFALDWPLLAFGTGISLVCVLVCGLAPAWNTSAVRIGSVLKEASPSAGRGKGRMQRAFVVAQVALSVGLVAVSALVLDSMRRIVAIQPGYQTRGIAVATMDISLLGYDAVRGTRFFMDLTRHVSTLPGVRSATLGKSSPAVDWSDRVNVFRPGEAPPQNPTEEGAPNSIRTDRNIVAPAYFATLGIPLIAGRDFRDSDRTESSRVAIVNQSLARRLWGEQNSLGRQLLMPVDLRTAPVSLEVIGVAADARYRTVLDQPSMLLYVPLTQNYDSIARLMVAVDGNAGEFKEPLRRAIQSFNPDLPLRSVSTMQEQIDQSLWERRAAASVLTMFGLLALGLASTGVHAVVAYATAQRSREIGIRMALGAGRGVVQRQVAGQSLRLALVGIAAGIPIALWAKTVASAFLYQTDGVGAATLGGVAALFAAIALAASAMPARKAASTDPATVLRHE